MVSVTALAAMALSAAVSVLLPVAVFIYWRRKEHISYKVTGTGIITFVFFALLLERILHTYVFTNPVTQQWLASTTVYVLYGSLAAGIFEEGGRFIMFRWLLPNRRSWQDGLAFGIGHGGIESILLGGMTSIQNIIFALSLNAGTLDQSLGGALPTEVIASLKATLVNSSPLLFLAAGWERAMALAIQISFSLLVLYGIKRNQIRYVLLAIVLHALFDVPAALYQKEAISLPVAEAAVTMCTIGVLLFGWSRRE